jgi:hypothetical protein
MISNPREKPKRRPSGGERSRILEEDNESRNKLVLKTLIPAESI